MIRLHTLGATELISSDGSQAHSILQRSKHLALLVSLAASRPHRFHRRDELTALLWPELDKPHARGALRQAIHHLRRALGTDILVARGDQEVSTNPSHLWCDAVEFDALLQAADLEGAIDVYRGAFLPGFHVADAIELERWIDAEREHLARNAAAAAETLVRQCISRHDLAAGVRYARRALDLAPYDESAARVLVELLIRVGARGDAIQVYEAFATRLAQDLELNAAPEFQAFMRSMHAGAATRDRGDRSSRAGAVPNTLTEARPSPRRWRQPLRVVLLTVLAGLGASYAQTRRQHGDERSTLAPNRVAVLPFQVVGDARLAYLENGLADLLSTRLDGAGDIRAVDVNAVLAQLRSQGPHEIHPDTARAIAARFGAGSYVLGRLTDAGGQLRGHASWYDARGRLRGTAEATIDAQSRMFELVDDLARQLVVLSPIQPADRMARVGALSTESFTALKAYLDGERLQRDGQYDSAVVSYARATAADSTFALAYYRMAVAQYQDASPTGPAGAHRRALALAEGLAPRDRLLVEAFAAFARHDDREAERLYREVLSLHPDDVDSWVFLGEVITYYGLWRGRPIADARHAYERALAIDSSHFVALKQLAWVAAMEEKFDEGAALTERMLAVQPNGDHATAARIRLALTHSDRVAEERALAELRIMDSRYITWAQRFAHFSGNLEGRMRVALLLTDATRPDDFRRLGHIVSSRYLLDRGRWTDAFAELAHVDVVDHDAYVWSWARYHLRPFAPASPQALTEVVQRIELWSPSSNQYRVSRLYLLGVIHARRRDAVRAEASVRELERLATSLATVASHARQVALARAYAIGIRAWRASTEGEHAEALAYLDKLRPEKWWERGDTGGMAIDAIQSWLKADVLVGLGRDREALHVYAPLGFLWGDAGTLAPKHYRMAEIYERLGDSARAAHHYRRFIEIWRECDPALRPLVRDAEARITRLARAG